MFQIDYLNPIVRIDMEDIDSRLLKERSKLYGKSVYVSGASGMIASYFVAYLIWLNQKQQASIQIYLGVRSLEKARMRFGSFVEEKYIHLICQDVNIPISRDYHFDYIIHAASLASPQYYGSKPVETMLPNVVGTYHLLQKAIKDSTQGFLFFSSGSVYGTVEGVNSITEEDIGKFDFRAQGNVYGESKRCGETLCNAYYREYGVPIKIVRIHHTYSPTADVEKDTRVFSEFTNDVVNNRDIVLKSSGTAKRAFCYITDAVVGLYKILLCGKSGETYNLGNPEEYISIADLADTIVHLFPEKGLHIIRETRNDEGYSASPEKRTIPVNVEKLEALDWEYTVSVKEGFRRMIKAIEYNSRMMNS